MDQETKKTNDEEVKTGDVKSPKDTKEKVEKKSVKDKVKEKINKVDPKDEKIKELEEQLKQAKNDRARAYADAENMKKRLQKEADNAKKYRFQQAQIFDPRSERRRFCHLRTACPVYIRSRDPP